MSPTTTPLADLCNYLFLNQQVHKPTRKPNILDLIFCPNDLINTISISDTFISDHQMIPVNTFIPVQCCVPNQIFNPAISKYNNFLSCFEFFIDILYDNC